MIGYNRGSSKFTTTYGGKYEGSRYGGYTYGSLWSWGSGLSGSLYSDDKPLYVKEPANYMTPKANEIEKGSFVHSQEQVDQIKELARVCYFKMIGDKDYLDTPYKDIDKLDDDTKAIVSQKKEFYDQIYDKFIPGFTPLEQANAIYEQLRRIENRKGQTREDGEELVHDSAALNFDRRAYTDVEMNELLEMNEVSKERKMNILNIVSIIGDFGTEFKVEKKVEEKIVSNSDTYAKRMLRDYAQISQIDLYQRLFPHFQSKLLAKDLIVNVPVDKKEEKQKIIILLDFSGSMDCNEKQDWVNAILIDRFRYVMKGEAEVFFSYFVDDTSDLNFHHLTNKQEVIDFWMQFSNRPNGGETHIGNIVNYVSDEISCKRLHNLNVDLSEEKPEILIINDGQDEVKTKKFSYKVNAITLRETNKELQDLCIETKGKLIEVSRDETVKAHHEGGSYDIN